MNVCKVNALPPVEAANQPLNVNPDLVGVPGVVAMDPPVVVVPFEIAEPLWLS